MFVTVLITWFAMKVPSAMFWMMPAGTWTVWPAQNEPTAQVPERIGALPLFVRIKGL